MAEEKCFKKMQKECEEFAKLKFTCQRLLVDAPRVIEGKTELRQRVFMNMEVRDTKHVVVKLADDVLVEMKLQDAIKVCDRKMDMLKNMLEKSQNTITRLKTDLTLLLATMDMPYVEPYRFTLPPDFPFRMEV
uniref:Prefoldin subunit 4 n=1 Tax=Caenorhabditis tropicalis TaxID=1561998 RepID=A0A1I7UB41_9PELO